MNCSRIKEYICHFIDGELDSQTSQLVEEHLSRCPLCSWELEQEKKIDSLIRRNITKEKAPYELREAILNQIEKFGERKVGPLSRPRLKPVLAASVITFLMVIVVSSVLVNINKPFPVFAESVSSHIKFLQGGLPIEIASSNLQEVDNWFQGKLDFHVMVPDYSTKGIQLLGGRLCYLKDKPVAYIMYKKGGQSLSLFMFDAPGLRRPRVEKLTIAGKDSYLKTEKGYHSLFWVDEGIGCVLVSDLNIKELIKLIS